MTSIGLGWLEENLADCLEQSSQGEMEVLEPFAQQMTGSLKCAKLPPYLKRTVNKAHLENDMYNETLEFFEIESKTLENSTGCPS